MDALDIKILSSLLKNSRKTWTELAAQLELSIPSVTERVRKLEEQGIVKGYATVIDYQTLGFSLTAIVFVTLAHPQYRAEFVHKIQSSPAVLECLHVTGDDDYMLKIVCIDCRDLDLFLNDYIKSIPGVLKTRTTIALSEPKCRSLNIPENIRGLKP